MSRLFHHALTSQYKINETTGEGSLTYISAANCVTPEVVIYGKCVQSGTPSPDAPVKIACNSNSYDCGGTVVTAPELYAVGDVRDEYYPLTGKIVRRCGKADISLCKQWWQYPSSSQTELIDSNGISFCTLAENSSKGYGTSICTHFENVKASFGAAYKSALGIYSDDASTAGKYFRAPSENITTVADFKAWCAEQTAAGTPIMLVYALAEPVIEYVAPVTLTSKRGINTITEEGSMTSTEIGVKYLSHS